MFWSSCVQYYCLLSATVFISLYANVLENAFVGDPIVECMEDRIRLRLKTERPFKGRIFVKGLVENDRCFQTYEANSKQMIVYQIGNGQCNMRRSRKVSLLFEEDLFMQSLNQLGPERRGIEQSITVVISFHSIFVTKIDRAYKCTCFYQEADKIVTNRLDVSMMPTTEVIDAARTPVCTYSVRRGSVNGPPVQYATVGESVFHVWRCDSEMFYMLVHNCFVDDGAGKDRRSIIDENGCSLDSMIIPDLKYNQHANMAYSEVSVFKFADKAITYFQCAVSTCAISEGLCSGKTPPRCGTGISRKRRSSSGGEKSLAAVAAAFESNTMDVSEKVVVLDLDDSLDIVPQSSNNAVEKILLSPLHTQKLLTDIEPNHRKKQSVCFAPLTACSILLSALISLSAFTYVFTIICTKQIMMSERKY